MKVWRQTAMLFILVVVVTACAHTEAIQNVNNAPIPSGQHTLSSKMITGVIARAAIDRGWTVGRTEPGVVYIQITKQNTYTANAKVTYTDHSYSITLLSSQNLDQDNGMISFHYNRYIEYLKRDIDKGLGVAAFN